MVKSGFALCPTCGQTVQVRDPLFVSEESVYRYDEKTKMLEALSNESSSRRSTPRVTREKRVGGVVVGVQVENRPTLRRRLCPCCYLRNLRTPLLPGAGTHPSQYVFLVGGMMTGKSSFTAAASTPRQLSALSQMLQGRATVTAIGTDDDLNAECQATPLAASGQSRVAFLVEPRHRSPVLLYLIDTAGELTRGTIRNDNLSEVDRISDMINNSEDLILLMLDPRAMTACSDQILPALPENKQKEQLNGNPFGYLAELGMESQSRNNLVYQVMTGADILKRTATVRGGIHRNGEYSARRGTVLYKDSLLFDECTPSRTGIAAHVAAARQLLKDTGIATPYGTDVPAFVVSNGVPTDDGFDYGQARNVLLPIAAYLQQMGIV